MEINQPINILSTAQLLELSNEYSYKEILEYLRIFIIQRTNVAQLTYNLKEKEFGNSKKNFCGLIREYVAN